MLVIRNVTSGFAQYANNEAAEGKYQSGQPGISQRKIRCCDACNAEDMLLYNLIWIYCMVRA
jgi:hypothetical protein